MSTKNDLLDAWTILTGDDVAESRHRIRALSEAELLPNRKDPLSYTHIANALLGFTASVQHKDAGPTVSTYSKFRCTNYKWTVGEPRSNQAARLTSQPLLEAFVAALQPPLRLLKFDVNVTAGACVLMVGEGYRTAQAKSGKESQSFGGLVGCQYNYKPVNIDMHLLSRINVSRTILFPLVDALLVLLMDHPEPAYMLTKEYKRTKEASPPRATPSATPSKAPKKPHEESGPWVWPPQFDQQKMYSNEYQIH